MRACARANHYRITFFFDQTHPRALSLSKQSKRCEAVAAVCQKRRVVRVFFQLACGVDAAAKVTVVDALSAMQPSQKDKNVAQVHGTYVRTYARGTSSRRTKPTVTTSKASSMSCISQPPYVYHQISKTQLLLLIFFAMLPNTHTATVHYCRVFQWTTR